MRGNGKGLARGALMVGVGTPGVLRRDASKAERLAQRARRAMVATLFPESEAAPLADIDQRYTIPSTDEWCRAKAGVTEWDLDVAACEEAHLARGYYTKADDGLTKSWGAGRVWCNPPFSDIGSWVEKAHTEMAHPEGPEVIAMLLPANRTQTPWWQKHVEPHRDRSGLLRTFFLPGRTRFGLPGNPRGKGVGDPPFGCVLLVWRR